MNDADHLLGWLPNDLSDEAAFHLYTLAEQFVESVECKYGHQIRRHIASLQQSPPDNLDLWENNADF